MSRHQKGFSLLEILMAGVLLAALIPPLYGLFSSQQREILWTTRESQVHSYMMTALLEEESRLIMSGFTVPKEARTEAVQIGDFVTGIKVTQVVKITPCRGSNGLYNVRLELAEIRTTPGPILHFTLSRLVVDREAGSLVPAGQLRQGAR